MTLPERGGTGTGDADPPSPATSGLVRVGLDALAAAGVPACLLRAPQDDEGTVEEADVLADPAAAALVGPALHRAGFEQLRAWGRGPHRFFVALDEASGRWIKLDVVLGLSFGRFQEYPTRAAAAVLARATREGGVARPAPQDAFWTLLFHCVLDKAAVPPRHAATLARLAGAAAAEGELPARAAAALRGAALGDLLEAARLGDEHALLALAPGLRAGWSRPAVTVRRLRNRALRKAARVAPGRGLRVAVLGPDGAGKSTLVAALEASTPLAVRRFYAGLYAGAAARRAPGAAFLARLARTAAVSLRAAAHARRGGIALLDRHPLEGWLAGPPTVRRGVRLRRRLLAHLAGEPDLVVVLDCPAEVLYARKREHDVETLRRMRERYLTLRSRSNVVVVDAARPAAEVARTAAGALWHGYRGRRG